MLPCFGLTSALRRQRLRESNEMNARLAQGEWHYDAWWWISFVDSGRPEGSQFLGVTVVQGGSLPRALANAWDLGINPGGEALALQIPAPNVPASHLRNRLLAREESIVAGMTGR